MCTNHSQSTYMGDFEGKHIYPYPLQPLFYVRFIDDGIFIWQHEIMELMKFLHYLNTRDNYIKFTWEISPPVSTPKSLIHILICTTHHHIHVMSKTVDPTVNLSESNDCVVTTMTSWKKLMKSIRISKREVTQRSYSPMLLTRSN